ncbi:NPC intracellular cholesterol transporter 2-like [Portunus trituberculatus]|uniref:NPC intracellular cholesterol transporter 2-like n=1 Tax=Portunus trituberculatus TaxID=210409 RepID=UPI001E1CCCBD|nr:NPC intracellular cholesterol transporter 2-like [Portunus trituberculatus]
MERCTIQAVVVVIAAVWLGAAQATVYQDCGSTADIHEFSLSYCEVPPCIVHRPSNYDVNITFTPTSAASELETIIIATISGVDFPWPGPEGCSQLENDVCPLQIGHKYKYSAFMPVLVEYPAISVVVQWKLKDENDVIHFCAMFPITIV